jgi:AcrR family transcriptional regulator
MNTSKDRILDAAERVVLRDGVGRLTLDAVAQETQLSKGGLLYHFKSKDDLIRGMIRRIHDHFEAEVARQEAADPNPTGRKLRALLNTNFPKEPCERKWHIDSIAASLLAAVATNPALLDDLKVATHRLEQDLLNDGLDPILAMIIHMAADGIWMSGLFGIATLPANSRARSSIGCAL